VVRLFFQLIFALVAISITAQPAGALMIPPDPFDATDRYALLLSTSDGTVNRIQAKIKAQDVRPRGPGKLIAQLRYHLPHSTTAGKTVFYAVSTPLPLPSLSEASPLMMTFDLTSEPIPAEADRRTLTIFYLADEEKAIPESIAVYPPDQLLLQSGETVLATELPPSQTAVGGHLMLGPLKIIRERGAPQTNIVKFVVTESSHTFHVRLMNGDHSGRGRVFSAEVSLNGHPLFRPSELNRRVGGLFKQVAPKPGENLLEVTLHSEPGAFISLELFEEHPGICRAFGPRTFVRSSGKPITERVTFPLLGQLTEPFTLRLLNGDPHGAHRVDSGNIALNGQAIFGPNQFNEQMGKLSHAVSLQASNTLSVRLNGKPGDQFTLEITGVDHLPPRVTITGPVQGESVTESPISVTGSVDDPSAIVTVNEITAVVLPDGTWLAEGIPLVDGENTLAVTATDSCGNQGSDDVTIRLQTAPVGPELTLCAERFVEQTPKPPGDKCSAEALGVYLGFVAGLVDETAVSVALNGVLLPDGVEVFEDGPISDGMREGTFFWAFVNLPQVDGLHSFTAIATNARGEPQTATVDFLRDTVPPHLAITAPQTGVFLNTSTVTVAGTVDDPDATVRLGFFGQTIPVSNGIFQVLVDLPIEGTNSITISAKDPSGNTSSSTMQIIRDTVPPAMTILTPQSGSAVNTPTVTVHGAIADQNPVTATFTVNASPPQPITLSAGAYSNTVTLESGMNTLLVEAIDAAGNRGTATNTILLDTTPPMVSITAPAAGAQLSGVVSVTADVSDLLSGVSHVELLANGMSVADRPTAPYSFSLNTARLPAGATTLTVHAADQVGNSAESSIVVIVLGSQIAFQITSPVDGDIITQTPILIRGLLKRNDSMPITEEVGITVNGYVAQFQGTEFGVEGIVLEPGVRTLTATATGNNGLIATTAIETTLTPGDPDTPPLSLNVSPSCAVFPSSSTVTFTTDEALPYPIVSYQLDADGNGVTDVESQTSPELSYAYANPGLYFPTLTAIDSEGNQLTATTMVNVLDQSVVDGLLRGKWTVMVGALSNGDTTTALNQISTEARSNYETMFNLLQDQLSSIMSTARELNFLSLTCDSSRYELVTAESGGTYSYEVVFSKDSTSIWKIKEF